MPTGTKKVSAGPNFLWHTKIYLDIVPFPNFLFETKSWFAFSKFSFSTSTKTTRVALHTVHFSDWHKIFGSTQNILWPVLEFVNNRNLPLIIVYVETARQVPGATIQIQTSAVQTINRTWKIKTTSLECETNFKYVFESSTLRWKKQILN